MDYLDSYESFNDGKVLEELNKKNLLGYGKLLSTQKIEDLYSIKKDEADYREWNFCILNLMGIVYSQGYFSTTRGRNGALYILKREEMPEFNSRCNRLQYKNLRKRQRCLYMVDPTLMKKEEKKKLEFEILRNGHLQLEMSKEIKQRCRY